MLLPLMHQNIAQISRWWVAKTIITASLDPSPLWSDFSDAPLPIFMTLLHMASSPSNIAPLPTVLSSKSVSDESEDTSLHETK